jgi:hypothetical protein
MAVLDATKVVYFRNGYRYKHERTWKQQQQYSFTFSRQRSFHISAASGAPISDKGVRTAETIRRNVDLGLTTRDPRRSRFLGPYVPGPTSMPFCLRGHEHRWSGAAGLPTILDRHTGVLSAPHFVYQFIIHLGIIVSVCWWLYTIPSGRLRAVFLFSLPVFSLLVY